MTTDLTMCSRSRVFYTLFAVVFALAVSLASARAAIRITGFTPASGPVGTSVTLTGEGFSTVAGDNIVRLGGQIATVTAASETSLTVTVPAGATYGAFNVVANGLTAESPLGFVVTFPVRPLNASAFGSPSILNTGIYPTPSDVADLDGDGRPDLIVANHHQIGIYRNDGTGSLAGLFSLVVNIPSSHIPGDIRLSDVNGDGRLDIVTVNFTDSAVNIYRNTGTNGLISFAPKISLPVTDGRGGFAVADLDGDGRLDIATPSFNAGNIRVFRNNGESNGISFATPVDFPTQPGPSDVTVQDLDGDGKPDLVVLHHTGNTTNLVVMQNVSEAGIINNNSFPITARLAASGNYVVLGDMDSDGRPEIVAGGILSHELTVIQNFSTNGSLDNSAFGTPVHLPTAGVSKRVAISDLDGDGRLDLATVTELSDSLGIIRNLGGTNAIDASWFAPRFDLAAGWNADGISISDFDLDGYPDILFCNIYGNQVWLYRSVAPVAPVGMQIAGFGPASGPVGTEVTLTGAGFDPVASNNVVWINGLRATVISVTSTSLVFTVPAGATYGPVTVTANGLSVQSTQPFTTTFPTRLLDSSAFDAASKFSPGDGPIATSQADLDGDGRPELGVVNFYANTLAIYRGTETGAVAGAFAPRVDFTTGMNPYSLHFADMDGDGRLDAVVSHWGEDQMSVFRNTSEPGQISFAARLSFSTGNGAHHDLNAAVGDLDGDGRLDMVVPSYDGGGVVILRNTSAPGLLSFAPRVDIPTMAGAHGVGIQDLDGDGKPDVVVNHHIPTSPAVVLLRNVSEPGIFNAGSLQAVGRLNANGNYVTFADFDADGRADIVTCSWYNHSVTLFQNLGTPGPLGSNSFGAPVTLPSAGSTKRIAAADLDGDGRVDLAFPTELGDSLGIYRNVGGTNNLDASWFAPRLDLPSGWNGDGISIGDIDLDGLPDIVFCSFYIDEVWIYRGQILTEPSIVTQPTNVTVALGGSASLFVQATGGGLHYSWYRNGQLLPNALGSSLPIINASSANAGEYFVIVQNSGGAVTSEVATVTVVVERTLALGSVADVEEGGLISVPLTLASSGDVGGIDFVINYDGTALAMPEIVWDGSLDGALKEFGAQSRGRLRGVIALPATAIPAGTRTLATIQFRARTVIQTNVVVTLGLQISDLADPFGDPILGGTEVLGTSFQIHDTGFLAGDNNANHQLDVGDAALLMRLIAQLDIPRWWDTDANDFNLNQRLDSGDVIKMLRAIAGLDAPGGGQPLAPGGSAKNALVPGGSEAASFSPVRLSGEAGSLVTLQVRLDDVDTFISGASFTLDYPVEALRLLNAQSHRVGPTVAAGTLAVWNVAPAQTNYAAQNGHITLALGGSTAWAASNAVLAEFTFEVLPAAATRHLWPITIGALEITGNGFNNRTLGPITGALVGRSPVSAVMSGMVVTPGGDVSFQFSGDAGASYRIEYSEDLIHWTLLRDVLDHAGPVEIMDAGAGGRPQRFYRNTPLP
jgi:hypothetical protein